MNATNGPAIGESSDQFNRQQLSRKQAKQTQRVQKMVGPDSEVLLAVLGRKRFAMTPGAWAMIVLFVGLLSVRALPGLIMMLIFRDLVRVPRWLAVTPQGLLVIARSGFNGKPKEILDRIAPNAVTTPERVRKITAGDHTYTLANKDASKFNEIIGGLRAIPPVQQDPTLPASVLI